MTFEEICKLDDRLLAIYQEAGAFRVLNDAGEPIRTFSAERAAKLRPDPNFCKQQLWRGVPGKRGEVGLLDQMKQCVGWGVSIPKLGTGEAYDTSYHTIHDRIPPCQHEGGCLWDYPAPKDIQPCPNCGSRSHGRDVKELPQMTSWTCQCGTRRESLKRHKQVGFGSLIDRFKHAAEKAAAEENGAPPPPPLALIDENTKAPDDKAEPVYVVRSEEDARRLALDLEIKARYDRGEITKWYARNCIYVCDASTRKEVLALSLNKDTITGPLGWKPVVLTFSDPDLERKLAQVCVQVVTVLGTRKPGSDYETFDIEQIREAVKEIKPVVAVDSEDMPLEVLDGWLGEVCRTRMLHDFPVAYAWPALLAAASVMVSAKLLPSTGGAAWDVRANVFVGIIGPVGSGKSSVFNLAFYLLGLKDPLLKRLKAGSGEGMAEDIGDVEGQPRLVFVDELEHLLKKINYKGATFANTLDDAYTTDFQQFRVANRKQITLNVRLSLAGGVPEQGFAETFGAGTVGGLHSRFLFGVCPSNFEGYVWSPPEGSPALTTPTEEDPEFLTAELRPQAITIDRSVWDETRRWQRELKIHGRCVELGLKSAVIAAAFDNRGTLKAADLGPALAFAKYQDRVHKRFQPNPGKNDEAIVAENVQRYLRENGAKGEWLNRRVMLKSINAYHHGPGTVNRALAALQQNNEIELSKAGRQLLVRLVLDRG